jgi:hypothetical protein
MRAFLLALVGALSLLFAFLFVLFLFVVHPYARAQAASAPAPSFRCMPKELGGTGSAFRWVLTAQGECEVWWCQTPAPAGASAPAGTTWWNIDRRCALHAYVAANALDPMHIVRSVSAHASGALTGANEAAASMSVKPANAAESYDYALLRYSACQEAVKPPAMVPNQVVAPDFCGPAPVPPPPPPPPPAPTVRYIVTGAQAFPLRADGSRSTTPIAQRPVLGSPCDCVAKEIIQYGARFCAVTIPAVTQLVVAGCAAAK